MPSVGRVQKKRKTNVHLDVLCCESAISRNVLSMAGFSLCIGNTLRQTAVAQHQNFIVNIIRFTLGLHTPN